MIDYIKPYLRGKQEKTDDKDSIASTIGNPPLVRLNPVTADLKCTVLAKVEFFNPGGSVKDRIGPSIIAAADLQVPPSGERRIMQQDTI